MLSTTVTAIQPQACWPGRPNTDRTATFGNAAPITMAETAPVLSPRDFTHAFQLAWRPALASMRPKTRLSKEIAPARGLKPRFAPRGNSCRCGTTLALRASLAATPPSLGAASRRCYGGAAPFPFKAAPVRAARPFAQAPMTAPLDKIRNFSIVAHID